MSTDTRSVASSSSSINPAACRRARECAGETDAAAFFRAEQHVTLEHLRTNIFEADAGFDQWQPMGRAHFVHHRSGRKRFHHPSPALSIHDEMMQQQTNDLVRRERVATAIHAANAVGITVGHEADVMRVPV